MRSCPLRALLWMAILAPYCSPALGQVSAKSASIAIEVKDSSGAAVPDALVLILPLPNTLRNELWTDRDGELSLDVPPGTYDLSVNEPGFRLARKHIEAQPGTHQEIAITLEVGGCISNCLAVTGLVAKSKSIFFPEQSEAVSPDGKYALIGMDSNSEPHHTVFLNDRVHHTQRKLFDYDGEVGLMWNPSSKLFAVTNYVDINHSRCSIFSVDRRSLPLQVSDLLFSELAESEQLMVKKAMTNRRVRVGAQDWDGPLELKVTIYAFGAANPDGFEASYTVKLPPGSHNSQ